MAFKLLDGVTAIGTGRAIRVGRSVTEHTVDVNFTSLAAAKISAITVVLQGASKDDDAQTGVITNPTLAVGSTAENIATALFYYRIAGTNYTKAAVTAGTALSAAHVVSASKYGVVLVYINAAGTITTKVPLATQAYTTAALAHAAGDAYNLANCTSDLCYLGQVLIAADSGGWLGITDNMTDSSGLTTATFLSVTSGFYDLTTTAFSGAQITAQRAIAHTTVKNVRFVRLFVSALTGTGSIDGYYTPGQGVVNF